MMCSKAVVLVGGLGTRLRPLTEQVPKPLVPLAGEPLMDRILRRLAAHGFSHVTLAVQYLAQQFRDHYLQRSDLGVELLLVEEPEPLGTAGAVRYALAQSQASATEPVLILNGDELSTLDWRELCRYHTQQQAEVTVAVRQVADPSAYGVVVADQYGRIHEWQEKPAPGTARAHTINSGAYVLAPHLLHTLPAGTFAMFERDIFPQQLAAGTVMQAFEHQAYSQDTGTLAGYLAANAAILEGHLPEYEPRGKQIAPGVWVAPHVQIDPTATLRGPIMLGTGTTVGARATLEYVVAWERVTIEADSFIRKAALATGCTITRGTTLEQSACGPHAATKAF